MRSILSHCSGETARVEMPKIPAQFTGTGDLFTALLLAWSGQEELQVCMHNEVKVPLLLVTIV